MITLHHPLKPCFWLRVKQFNWNRWSHFNERCFRPTQNHLISVIFIRLYPLVQYSKLLMHLNIIPLVFAVQWSTIFQAINHDHGVEKHVISHFILKRFQFTIQKHFSDQDRRKQRALPWFWPLSMFSHKNLPSVVEQILFIFSLSCIYEFKSIAKDCQSLKLFFSRFEC